MLGSLCIIHGLCRTARVFLLLTLQGLLWQPSVVPIVLNGISHDMRAHFYC
jgi:hypothetical protein